MISQRNEEEEPGEERDDNNPDGGSGQEFEMKMSGTEKPGRTTAEKATTNLDFLGYVDVSHYKRHKSKYSAIVPAPHLGSRALA
jgi:hypothetical protein